MKIVYWNIFKLGSSKLTWKLNQSVIAQNGLGNNILDYIVKVTTGDDVWECATSKVPADVIVILELVTGGTNKGAPGTGSCIRVLDQMKAALNAATKAKQKKYSYDYVKPLIIGHRETVGVLYNNKSLTYKDSESMRNASNNFLRPRTPFRASFSVKSSKPFLINIIGVHGPTSDPKKSDYRNAVVYTNDLAEIAKINQATLKLKEDTCVGGAFNCDPQDFYSANSGQKRKKVNAFQTLTTLPNPYKITLLPGTKTSLVQKIQGNNYLSQAYDNIVFLLPSQASPPDVKRVDLVGNSKLAKTNLTAVFNAARAVSDHLPVTVEF